MKDENSYKDEDVEKSNIFRVFLNEEEIKSENIPSKESNDFNIDKILDITNELKIEEDEFKKMLDSQADEEINKEKF